MSRTSKGELIFSFTKKDFRVDWYNPGKSGGQNINKNATACRIKHLESGLMASCHEHKSATQNKKKAFRKLVKLLVAHYAPKDKKQRGNSNEKHTRTYNEHHNYVKDHVTGDEFSYQHTVGRGDISEIIEARRQKWAELLND